MKKVVIGEVIIFVACFLLSAFYHWEINPDIWPVEHRGIIIIIYLVVAVIVYPFVLLVHSDINRESAIVKGYVGKEFIHSEKGKVRVTYLGSAARNDEEVYFINYTSLSNGHSFEEFLEEFQEKTKADKIKF